jgi:hypothetical protein
VSGSDGNSGAVAGVLGWMEIKPSDGGENDVQMVTVDDKLVAPPTADDVTKAGRLPVLGVLLDLSKTLL